MKKIAASEDPLAPNNNNCTKEIINIVRTKKLIFDDFIIEIDKKITVGNIE